MGRTGGVATHEVARVTTEKRWGDEAYYGLDREFDPHWFLTDEQKRARRRS